MEIIAEAKADERREFKRASLKEPVRFEFKDPQHFGGCVSGDISAGGIRLRVYDFIPLGTELTLEVQLSSNRMVSCEGQVVWVEKIAFGDDYRIGLKFVNTPALREAQELIQHFVEFNRLQGLKI